MTENFLKYIKNELLTFKVLGFPDVKKEAPAAENQAGKKKAGIKNAAAAAMG